MEAFRLANETVVIDNTSRQPIVLLRFRAGDIVESRLDPGVDIHKRVAKALAEAFDHDESAAYLSKP